VTFSDTSRIYKLAFKSGLFSSESFGVTIREGNQ